MLSGNFAMTAITPKEMEWINKYPGGHNSGFFELETAQ